MYPLGTCPLTTPPFMWLCVLSLLLLLSLLPSLDSIALLGLEFVFTLHLEEGCGFHLSPLPPPPLGPPTATPWGRPPCHPWLGTESLLSISTK